MYVKQIIFTRKFIPLQKLNDYGRKNRTLSFNESIAIKAKKYEEKNNVSLSRLVEFLLDKVTSSGYASFEEFPISDLG